MAKISAHVLQVLHDKKQNQRGYWPKTNQFSATEKPATDTKKTQPSQPVQRKLY